MSDLFAFWEYDSPPYFLGAPVTRICDDGKIEASVILGSGSSLLPFFR